MCRFIVYAQKVASLNPLTGRVLTSLFLCTCSKDYYSYQGGSACVRNKHAGAKRITPLHPREHGHPPPPHAPHLPQGEPEGIICVQEVVRVETAWSVPPSAPTEHTFPCLPACFQLTCTTCIALDILWLFAYYLFFFLWGQEVFKAWTHSTATLLFVFVGLLNKENVSRVIAKALSWLIPS